MFLTIAIPAYNRPHNLDILLSGLANILTPDVQVFVCDDASPEKAKLREVVEKYASANQNIKYFLNEQNLGYSGNVFHLYELADSRYIWFLCDDDVVNENAIKDITFKLKKYEPTVAVFNHTQNDPYDRVIKAYTGETDLVFNSDNELSDPRHLLRLCFLSTLVVEKIDELKLIKQSDYKNNIFVQITCSFCLLSKKFRFAEFTDVILHRQVGFKYGEFFKFYMIDVLKSIYLVPHSIATDKFRKWAVEEIPNALKLYLSQKLGLFRYWGKPTKETLKLLVSYYGVYAVAILFFPVIRLLTPTLLLKSIYFLQLCQIHGFAKAKIVYAAKINRAYTDTRKTGFTSYR